MAGTWHSIRPLVIGSTVVKLPLSGATLTKPPFSVRVTSFPARSHSLPPRRRVPLAYSLALSKPPALDADYSGEPLIVDNMFDRVELKLRWYGSKSVVKYPRCSIRQQSTYADAEEDLSQGLALASIWILIFAFGCTLCLVPIIYTISLAYQDPFSSDISCGSQASNFEFLATVNGILFMGIGLVVGYPLASAAFECFKGCGELTWSL
ncbi:uncharacterized protein LOC111302150 [Durio zibethinus]|uniref:Uncharacterized protein LOC111302150 n=1 Tax=Durio zibethinus TaxID=66656 RepID=A0A6P5ZLW5_DURZI|nr:uncharacterized protein LOC111302150 [Durio zibethinus]XP_022753825.1 uncharacterized protein LOC111302150 [Durio zibethinus]XP_022753826.1 uncharacterized protein LOC111302150 [Durio zibethinus]